MATRLTQKASLSDFTDRELLLLILSNQIKIFRQTQDILNKDDEEPEGLGAFAGTFESLLEDSDIILDQANQFLEEENKED